MHFSNCSLQIKSNPPKPEEFKEKPGNMKRYGGTPSVIFLTFSVKLIHGIASILLVANT